jgi:hypothetical protein
LEFETEDARFRLAVGELTCEMKTHFSTAEDARTVVEPILRAWETDADLRLTRGELRFKFDGAEIIDRSPTPSGVVRAMAIGVGAASATGTVFVHVTRGQYPDPPSSFRLNPDAQSILDRFCGYLDGHEPLLAMAYFCVTVLEQNAGGRSRRSRASARYRIDKKVLDTMGTLTSKHGDHLSARKASATHPLTGSESAWLEAAVKKLIWQLGTPEAARSSITMSDLPAL